MSIFEHSSQYSITMPSAALFGWIHNLFIFHSLLITKLWRGEKNIDIIVILNNNDVKLKKKSGNKGNGTHMDPSCSWLSNSRYTLCLKVCWCSCVEITENRLCHHALFPSFSLLHHGSAICYCTDDVMFQSNLKIARRASISLIASSDGKLPWTAIIPSKYISWSWQWTLRQMYRLLVGAVCSSKLSEKRSWCDGWAGGFSRLSNEFRFS